MKLCKIRKLLAQGIIVSIFALQLICLCASAAGKVLDINEKLPELLERHPDKGWLIKFYAPWCHHCQQLEPTFNNVAERVYDKFNHLIVGRVDCTKTSGLCSKYGVDSYPTIVYIDKDSQIKYRGDRSEESMVAFAARLQGPTVNLVRDCKQLDEARNKHDLIILSTISNASNPIQKEFLTLAHAYKATYWFYQYSGTCEGLLKTEGLYLLKRHVKEPTRFEYPNETTESNDDDNPEEPSHVQDSIVKWLNKESFPVYGRITSRNIEKALETGKLLIIAILDEYKPARRFALTSREFYKRFEELAKSYALEDNQVLFAWTSDLDLILYITIGQVSTPNVIILRRDFSYHLMLSDKVTKEQDAVDNLDARRLGRLSDQDIRSLLSEAKKGNLKYEGGGNYMFVIMRYIVGNLQKFTEMYTANPLLVSLIFGFPTLIITFVIYTTCFDEGQEGTEDRRDLQDDADDSDNSVYEDEGENQNLLQNGHLKQE